MHKVPKLNALNELFWALMKALCRTWTWELLLLLRVPYAHAPNLPRIILSTSEKSGKATCLAYPIKGNLSAHSLVNVVKAKYWDSFLSSKPFRVIGPGKRLFYAHGALLAECSPVMKKDVDGGMKETHLRTIEIKDVEGDIDDETVMRFIEYAYSGDYTAPDPDLAQLPVEPGEVEVPAAPAFSPVPSPVLDHVPDDIVEDWAAPTLSKRGKKDKKKRRSLTFADEEEPLYEAAIEEALYERVIQEASAEEAPAEVDFSALRVHSHKPVQEVRTPAPVVRVVDRNRQELWTNFRAGALPQLRSVWRPRDGNNEHENYTSIFLCHARLYKFSDRYGCETLMDLTLQKLRLTLSKYTFYSLRASDVVELVRYTYAHTAISDYSADKLRALVLDYVVCYSRELLDSAPFLELLSDGGSLPTELMVRMAKLVI